MDVDVLPAILAKNPVSYEREKKVAARLSRWAHLDVMDGVFVPNRSVGPRTVQSSPPPAGIEFHFMTAQISSWLPVLWRTPKARAIIHVELGRDVKPWLALFRSRRVPTILAINPTTPIGRLRPWIRHSAGVQVMSVPPGQYGSRWWPGSVARIRNLHHAFPRLLISVDGGMDATTIPRVVQAGARRIIVGSAVMLQPNPTEAWQRIRRLV